MPESHPDDRRATSVPIMNVCVSPLCPATDRLQRSAFFRSVGTPPAAGTDGLALQRHPPPLLPAAPGRHLPALHTSIHLQGLWSCHHSECHDEYFRWEIFLVPLSHHHTILLDRTSLILCHCDANVSSVLFFLAPTIDEYDGTEAFLNETATTITVLLKPAQAKGAPIR